MWGDSSVAGEDGRFGHERSRLDGHNGVDDFLEPGLDSSFANWAYLPSLIVQSGGAGLADY